MAGSASRLVPACCTILTCVFLTFLFLTFLFLHLLFLKTHSLIIHLSTCSPALSRAKRLRSLAARYLLFLTRHVPPGSEAGKLL